MGGGIDETRLVMFIIVEVGAGDMEAHYTILSGFYKIFQNKYAP